MRTGQGIQRKGKEKTTKIRKKKKNLFGQFDSRQLAEVEFAEVKLDEIEHRRAAVGWEVRATLFPLVMLSVSTIVSRLLCGWFSCLGSLTFGTDVP